MKKYFLYITVFFSGMTALAVELSASRLLGNVFGSSNLVWASIIGLILIYLTVGYWLGGKIADRFPQHQYFYRILMWGSLTVGLVPMVSRPILRITANAFDLYQMPILAGAFVTVMVLFIIPVTLLGMISPFALKLTLVDATQVGKTAGRLSAISTLGAFIGTFLPVLILVPLIGTYRTFLFFSSLLMLVATVGFWVYVDFRSWLRMVWMPMVLILLWLFGAQGADKATQGLIFEGESSYNYIQVVEQNQFRYLRLNEGQGMHSVFHPTQLNYFGPWSQVLVAPFFNPPLRTPKSVQRMAIVGLAAGTTARQAQAVYGDIEIDGFEIDPLIVEVGRTYFDMNQPGLEVFVQDGRWGLERSRGSYDIISVDAYRPPYIPWQMTTLEFFQVVHERLAEDGVMVINIGRSPLDRTLVNDLGTTIRQVFPTIFVMDVPDSFNTMLFATKQAGSWDYLMANYSALSSTEVHPLLLEAMATTITFRQQTPDVTRVYTDDLAPIEWLTNKIVVDYFLSGGLEDMQ
ncbi:MAG: fused MFS/spermidine synthase [Brevefilum sp.]|nr:fused MFS/spermidine synthase [Brevefilum sp.]